MAARIARAQVEGWQARIAAPATMAEFGARLFGGKDASEALADHGGAVDARAIEGGMPPYNIPNVSIDHYPANIGLPTGQWRGGGAKVVSTNPANEQPLARVSMSSLLMTFGTLFAVYSLLGQIGDPGKFWHTISSANFWWIGAALVVSFSTNIATAVVLMGTVKTPLPLWRTSELQLSMSFANLAVPAVGGMGS